MPPPVKVPQMVDPITSRRWLYRALFLLIGAVVMFFEVLPLDLAAGRWPGPDLAVAFAFAWVLRRPDFVPVFLIAVVFLTMDLLFMRPPGLWSGMVVLGSEFLRSREPHSRDLPFLVEWVLISGVLIAMTLAARLIQMIFVVNQPSFGLIMLQLTATIASYPFVVGVSRMVFGIRKIAPGEVDQLGHPL